MAADTITRGNIKVYVYEVKALKSQYLKNLDEDKLVTDVFWETYYTVIYKISFGLIMITKKMLLT